MEVESIFQRRQLHWKLGLLLKCSLKGKRGKKPGKMGQMIQPGWAAEMIQPLLLESCHQAGHWKNGSGRISGKIGTEGGKCGAFRKEDRPSFYHCGRLKGSKGLGSASEFGLQSYLK